MIRGTYDTTAELDPQGLRETYDGLLAEAIEAAGIDEATDRTGIEGDRLQAVLDGEQPELILEEAAAVLALGEDQPDADTVLAEARDILMMGMSQAVLDVEALASGINDAMDPKEIQQKIEGRYPMTLDEYALVHAYIENRK